MDLLNGRVRVYNYEQSPIGFPSQFNEYGVFISGREEDDEYRMERVSWEDIEIENTKSDIFKVGRLRFHPSEEEEIYNKLGIYDKENIKNDRELIDMLTDDSIENLKKINNIKSHTLLSRMKAILFKMERINKIPPHNISAVISERYEELKNGGRKNGNGIVSQIIKRDNQLKDDNKLKETLAELNKKFELLEKENKEKDEIINQSQTAIQDLLKMVEELKTSQPIETNIEDVEQTEVKAVTKKSPGRPKKEV
jgi:hypothetical protein